MTVKKRLIACFIMLISSVTLTILAFRVPGFAQWYSMNIYPILVTTVGRVFGWFPFAVVELLMYISVVIFIVSIIYMIIRLIRDGDKKERLFKWLVNVFLVINILALSFVTNCGINYHRTSFAEMSGIEVTYYSIEELTEVAMWLTYRVNEVGEQVIRNENGEMVLTVDIASNSIQAMQNLSNRFPVLEGHYPPPNPLIFPRALSVMQVSGIFIPFTIEGIYNNAMVDYNIPFVATHELVHVRGFMQEEEANFVAFLACIYSPEVEFQYSGYLLGWIYVNNAMRRVDSDAANEFRDKLNPDIISDLRANRAFWAQYEGPISDMQTRVNDAYLRANAQPEGVRSYGMMVDLVIAYFVNHKSN